MQHKLKGARAMWSLMQNLALDDGAQDLAEYGIALAVIGLVAGAAAVIIAGNVGTLWSRANSVIGNAANP